jgi:hypothetical protein
MRNPARVIPLLALSILAAACLGGAPSSGTPTPVPDQSQTHVPLAVENHNWADVIVSVEHDGTRQRLGTVKAASHQTLRIPSMWIGPSHVLRLIARRIGSLSEFKSEGFTVQLDQTVDWTLESDLQRSSLGLR